MELTIREFFPADSDAAISLWRGCEGIGLSSADEPARIKAYLERNTGFSFTAWMGADLAGAVLCGHDGRRGYLHHLAVNPKYRRLGIGHTLVERCHEALRLQGIEKVHIFVYHDNLAALNFWESEKYFPRGELVLMSAEIG